ncbi:MAG: hypothetical protein PHI63_02810 [Patescibacteria group bacterium]|nr:hypothetical protein [Patescibacteria group bacterium]
MSEPKRFLPTDGLPTAEFDIVEALRADGVSEIRNFVLGPKVGMSSICQACQRWLIRTRLASKATVITGNDPVTYLAQALEVREVGVVPLFWTSPVLGNEKDLFFGPGAGTLMFWIVERMRLDGLQLAARPQNATSFVISALQTTHRVPPDWRYITSHRSLQPLLLDVLRANRDLEWVQAMSTGHAAELCAAKQVDACVCTEVMRQQYRLETLQEFGSPDMLFFGGLTPHGASVIRAAYAGMLAHRDQTFVLEANC